MFGSNMLLIVFLTSQTNIFYNNLFINKKIYHTLWIKTLF